MLPVRNVCRSVYHTTKTQSKRPLQIALNSNFIPTRDYLPIYPECSVRALNTEGQFCDW